MVVVGVGLGTMIIDLSCKKSATMDLTSLISVSLGVIIMGDWCVGEGNLIFEIDILGFVDGSGNCTCSNDRRDNPDNDAMKNLASRFHAYWSPVFSGILDLTGRST